MEEGVLEKVEEIGRKLDELREFLEDVFLTTARVQDLRLKAYILYYAENEFQ